VRAQELEVVNLDGVLAADLADNARNRIRMARPTPGRSMSTPSSAVANRFE
jgi:hypothetical protein